MRSTVALVLFTGPDLSTQPAELVTAIADAAQHMTTGAFLAATARKTLEPISDVEIVELLSRKIGDSMLPHVISKVMGPDVGYDMVFHCASEMNHLASFLPGLHEELNGTP